MGSSLTDDQLRALKELRSRFSAILEPRHDDRFLLRWLRARDYNVDAAEKMLREDFKMRKKLEVDTILERRRIRPELEPYCCDKFLGFDHKGNAVHFFALCADYKGLGRAMNFSESVKYFIHVFEENQKLIKENNLKTGKDAERTTYIIDVSPFQASAWFDKAVLRVTVGSLSYYINHYPETMYAAYILNVPSAFWYFFNIFKRCLNDVILKKVKLYEVGDDSWQDLFSLVPKEILPAYLGGGRYEPDSKCSDMISWGKKVPTSLYLLDMNSLKISDKNVQKIVVRERSSFEVKKLITDKNRILCWEFQTECYSIKFGLFYEKKSENFDREELVPVEDVSCSDFVEKGEYECKKPGTYILHFDNTYSWFRAKTLLYKVEVINSPSSHN